MKILLLMRHAKSSWKEKGLEDFERPLNDRGRKAAGLIGKFLAKNKVNIDLVISSPAVRARQTIELVLRSARRSTEIRFDQRIYEATPAQLMEVISQIDEDRKAVMLVGHNPGMEELLSLLTDTEQHMVTGMLASIAVDTNKWDKVLEKDRMLEWVVKPKELKES
jgi:phosphohistidine phosphatase